MITAVWKNAFRYFNTFHQNPRND